MESFRDRVTSEEALRSLLGYPSELVARKAIPRLDQHCRDFIARSPFLLLATAGASGECDVSPRGDAPGFVLILDDHRLVIPERPGNRRMDSLRNIISNPHVGIQFLIPGLDETLRINGRACIIRDQELLERMAVGGRVPLLGIGVAVQECYVHCAKAFIRSRLWQPESWPAKSSLPSMARMVADHAQVPGMMVDDVEKAFVESYTKRLY